MQVPSMNSLEATAAGAGTDLPSSELHFSRPATRRQFCPWEPSRSHGNPMQILTQTQIVVQAPWRVRGPFQRFRCCGSRSASGVARFERLEDDADTGVQCAGDAAQRAQRMTLVARGFQATDDPIAVPRLRGCELSRAVLDLESTLGADTDRCPGGSESPAWRNTYGPRRYSCRLSPCDRTIDAPPRRSRYHSWLCPTHLSSQWPGDDCALGRQSPGNDPAASLRLTGVTHEPLQRPRCDADGQRHRLDRLALAGRQLPRDICLHQVLAFLPLEAT